MGIANRGCRRMVDQILIAALMVIALRVAVGLARKKDMWAWVTASWVVLSVRNVLSMLW